jgi:hypothetical protein
VFFFFWTTVSQTLQSSYSGHYVLKKPEEANSDAGETVSQKMMDQSGGKPGRLASSIP